MYKKYELELLTSDHVNVNIKSFTEIEGTEYLLRVEGKAYSNSEMGRSQIIEDLPEEYVNAVFALWGDAPTIEDPPYCGP